MTDTPIKSNSTILMFGVIILVGIAVMIAFVILSGSDDADSDMPAEPQLCSDTDLTLDDGGLLTLEQGCELTNFTFTATTGEPFSLSDLSGELALVYFGYTNCPDFCPPTMLDFRSISELLDENNEQVNFIFITVDPERDTVESLGDYMSRFEEDFIGLIGNDAELTRIADDYSLTYEAQPESAPGIYSVDHTISRYLIDENGRLIRRFSFALSPDAIADEIESVLTQ